MIFAFLISFFSFYHISMGGELYISELLFAVYLIFSINKFRLLSEPLPRKILLLGGLWLLSQIVTDVIRSTSPEKFLRGWASIIFFLIDFCALYIMVRLKPDVVRILILGSALGTVFSIWALPTVYSEAEPWKFGYGPPVTMLVFLYLSNGNKYKSKSGFLLLLLVLLGMLSVYLNARSLGGMTILTAAILYLSQQPGFRGYAKQRRSPIKLVGMAMGVMLAFVGILSVYQWAAESGLLPDNVTEKYLRSKSADAGFIGMILGGRSEILISSQAVIDSPIIGHGSWAEDAKYAYMQYEVVRKLGLDVDDAVVKYAIESSDLIPIHSVLMQAWVWAGVLGAMFWFYILRFLLQSTLNAIFSSNQLKPLQLFIGISSFWNLLFSPFGAGGRYSWALALMILLLGSVYIKTTKSTIAPNTMQSNGRSLYPRRTRQGGSFIEQKKVAASFTAKSVRKQK